MKQNKLNILDCTLRDGGYYNNWYFDKDLINEYLRVMNTIKVDYVEVGFRFVDKVKTKGLTAYSEENFLKSLKIPKNLKIDVMINATTYLEKNMKWMKYLKIINLKKLLKKIFTLTPSTYKIKFIK